MGGPDTPKAVRPFLLRLFSDRDLIPLPAGAVMQPIFAWAVSGLRARKVRRYYEEIGGGSPILKITESQRAKLESALNETGGNYKVYIGMRYWHPLSKHAALEMNDDGVSRAIALPMYPQYCSATTGSSFNDLRRWLSWAGCSFPVTEIRSWPEHPGYVAALTKTVAGAMQGIDRQGLFILFSAHGVPQRLINGGDTYRAETESSVAAVMRSFPGMPHSISWQSRAGREPWLSPDTFDEVTRLASEGVRRLIVVPVSFVSDNIETLHELDIRLAAHARETGIELFIRAPALNDSPLFIDALKTIVMEATRKGSD
jgi:ferrochelatase